MAEPITYVFDFDSTLVRIETLEVLADIALAAVPDAAAIRAEVEALTDQAMAILKSVMNTPGCIFIMTTNHFEKIERGVQDRCHCIPFLAAAAQKWLPLAHRMLASAGISTISDQMLINVINPCNGSARQIIDAITCVILEAKRHTKPTNSATV